MFVLAGCTRGDEPVELEPDAACVGTLEGCAREDAVWVPIASTAELDSRLEHELGRTVGSSVARYPLDHKAPAVRVEGGPHTLRIAFRAPVGASALVAEGALAPHVLPVPAGAPALLVEAKAYPQRALWPFAVHKGSVDVLEADTSRRVIAPTVVAVAALVIGALQFAAALERRSREGAMLVGGIATAMGVRSLVMQNHWTHWWSLETFRLAHALEFASIPVIGILSAAFYRWVAGLARNEPRIVWHRRVGLALWPLGAIVPASNGLTRPVVNALQLFAVWSAAETLAAVRAALQTVHAHERRIIVVGVGALMVGLAVDLVVSQFPAARYFLGIGALAPGFLVEMACQSLLVAKRNSRAHDRVDELAGELDEKNRALTRTNAQLEVSNTKLEDANQILAAELDERRRLQGELDTASQQLVQAENMATLGMLMAGIAHDLRNPLNYVQGAAEQLREAIPSLRSGDEAAREKSLARVEKVVGWVEQGTASMDAISLAMRNQARGGGEAFEAVALREVVNEALLLCRSRTKLCELEVLVDDVTVHADPTGLGQLVMNLVSNAADALVEAKGKGQCDDPRIRVSARAAGDRCTIAVEDSGTGIPEELRAKILEPFFTTKPRGQGTGLGLAIVQRVVKQHGGVLEVGTSRGLGGAAFEMSWGAGA
jgi:signal transduction histidine kinase